MNQLQIEQTLKLHKLAYSLLLWLKEQARNNRGLLDAKAVETISSTQSCEEWMVRHLSMIPVQLRLSLAMLRPSVAYSHHSSQRLSALASGAGGKKRKPL